MKSLIVALLFLPLLLFAQRVERVNSVTTPVVRIPFLPTPPQKDTLDRGFFLESNVSSGDYSAIGVGAYEKVFIGNHFMSMMDVKLSLSTEGDYYTRIRLGLGYRSEHVFILFFMPQFHQKNFSGHNTPLGVDIGLDRRFWMLSLSYDTYRDCSVLNLKARFQLRADKDRKHNQK